MPDSISIIIVNDDPVYDLEFYGPFDTGDAAITWTEAPEKADWYIVPLSSPERRLLADLPVLQKVVREVLDNDEDWRYEDWRNEVAKGDTRMSYAEWRRQRLHEALSALDQAEWKATQTEWEAFGSEDADLIALAKWHREQPALARRVPTPAD